MSVRYLPLVFLFFLCGCNLFNPLDPPANDLQYLSAARACFDMGDYTCAAKYYAKVSTSYSDTVYSELALEQMAQAGLTSGMLLAAATENGSDGGKFITQLAKNLIPVASRATRVSFFTAYLNHKQILDTKLQGLIRFLTGAALAAEILAEDASSTKLLKADIVQNVAACLAAGVPDANCANPSGRPLVLGGAVITLSTAPTTTIDVAAPTLFMLDSALNEVVTGANQLGKGGTFGNSSSGFASQINGNNLANALTVPSVEYVYRKALISLNIGE